MPNEGSKAKESGVIRWRGVLAQGDTTVRQVTAGVLSLLSVALAFTQVGFMGFQLADGSAAYLVIMLAPVALAACLLGTLPGAAIGLLAGVALYLHAVLTPLDYYESAYMTPLSSIVMMAICGLVLGMLLALILRRERAGAARVVFIALACLVVSCLFSAGFVVGAVAIATTDAVAAGGLSLGSDQIGAISGQAMQATFSAGNVLFQVIGDAALMALTCVLGHIIALRGLRLSKEAGLRKVFSVWLSVVALTAFLIVSTVGYGVVTARAIGDYGQIVRGEAEHLLDQVVRSAAYNGSVAESLMESGSDANDVVEMLSDGGALEDLLVGYSEAGDGLVLVSYSGMLLASDSEAMKDAKTLTDCLDADALAAADRSAADGTIERVIYEAPSVTNDLIKLAPEESEEDLLSLRTKQIGYMASAEGNGYKVITIAPASMVFEERNVVMRWVFLASLVLLIAVYALTWRLLDRLVARRIDATNTALARIEQGDLDARVQPDGSTEFKALSAGINSTVDALQGWIAEAKSRMDAELATAKTIQESALPRVFPPYPDILRFDIYASMNAAKEVGGDFYDFFLIGDSGPDAGKLGFVMADVSGKGVPGALFMMKAKTQIRDYLEAGMELGEAIENANRQLVDGNDAGMFVTAWIGVLDYESNRIEFVNAGHNPPLLWQFEHDDKDSPDTPDSANASPKKHWRWLTEKSGMPLGLFDGFPYETFTLECKSGDTLLLYTDGVTEAMSTTNELYGEDRLEKLVDTATTLRPRDLVRTVRADVAKHAEGAEQSDDITILVLEVGVPPEEKTVLVVPADTTELNRVNEFIHSELDRRLCPMRVQKKLDIAVEELFVNSCRYAYKDMGEDVPRTVRITQAINVEPPSVTVEIIDAGTPFDPLAKPDATKVDEYDVLADIPIGALGILMAKNNVDEMRYERLNDENVITLVQRW